MADGSQHVFMGDSDFIIEGKKERSWGESEAVHKNDGGEIKSPMPGKVFKVLCKEGDSVKSGAALIIVEAMKMEHTLYASKDAVVKKVLVTEGAQVKSDELLAILD